MKLIVEDRDFDDVHALIVEHKEDKVKKYIVEGIYIQADIKNRNNRIYPKAMLEEEVENYVNEKVLTKRALGELNHPPTPAVNPERACHLIESLKQDGSNWIGQSKVLTTLPCGAIVKGLIEEGVKFGTSTRGVGGLKQNSQGITEVFNYKLATAGDIVLDPSAPNCFLSGIMESVDWIVNPIDGNFVAQQMIEDIKKERHDKKIDEDRILKLFNNYLKIL